MYSREQVLKLLIGMDQAINPETYERTKEMSTDDFRDLALSLACTLGIEEEFKAYQKSQNYLG